MDKIPNVAPGEILKEDFLDPMGIQDEYDLRDEQERLKEDLKRIPRVQAFAG